MKSKKSKGLGKKLFSTVLVISIMGLIAFMAIPPGYFSNNQVVQSDDSFSVSDVDLIAQTSLGFLQNSVIGTIPDSDYSLIQQTLDNTDSDLGTEKFDIVLNVSECLPDETCTVQSDRISPGETPLSLLDSDGFAVDLNTIKLTLSAESANVESIINVWGIYQIYLDDDLIPTGNTKYFYGSGENTDTLNLSIHDSLTFTVDASNTIEFQTQTQESLVQTLSTTLTERTIGQSSTGRFVPDPSLPALTDQLETETIELQRLYDSQISNVKRAVPPPFSSLENKEHVLTILSDSNSWTTDEEHVYRIVVSEIHAVLESSDGTKEFHTNNRHISYELNLIVDESQLVILDELNNIVQVTKSDSTFNIGNSIESRTFWSKSSGYSSSIADNNPKLPTTFEVLLGDESLGKLSNEDSYNYVLQQISVVYYRCDYDTCSNTEIQKGGSWDKLIDIPRDADITIRLGTGEEIDYHTSKSQQNLIVTCNDGINCTSNFGFTYP